MLLTDARAACAALDVAPEVLADVARRETARLLREAADLIDSDPPRDVIDAMLVYARATHWTNVASAAEALWEESSDEINTERNGGKSPRPSGDSPVSGGADLAAGSEFSQGQGR